MTKRLVAKTGTYQKDGQEKGEYTKLGVILQNDNGEYMLLDPAVSISGVLAKQNALAVKEGKQVRDSVMVSIFTDEPQAQMQQGQQQAQPQYQQPQQQQGPQSWGNTPQQQGPQSWGNAPQQQY